MRLSAPLYRLKHKARLLSRQENIPLHQALDRIAAEEGFRSWSLLATRADETTPAGEIFSRLKLGDLVLLGARPRHGKTLMSLRLAVEAMKSGNRGIFFTLEYTEREVVDRFEAIGAEFEHFRGLFEFDSSDAISADYIIERLASAPKGTLVVVDYLQILDQNRRKPELMVQVQALKAFAREKGLVIVFISQIDRSYESSAKTYPDLEDVRLPNPLDLGLFDKTFFLNKGEVQIRAAG
ncbi:DNA helicase [Agrobacterium sp. SHOUNA12C]|uniref:SF4 helicase domain-containing protein n=1 Tax=Rhizobium rhizogenes NBRC 13257 TaxID=1220581 RepID=A0AA87Q573_RHIRH|nr:DNA helicase [Rhizobium rhizogenes]MCJ9724482.1 DNA helicase [Agrobacterium sp. BETTINA12B]MCJ9760867.1 DNA helicase [Agrobacterium sp. SHOUNA12C]OCJ08717.1 DNA helicase [Agrobacterium sp. B131/95]NTF56762.1 DNA helicase [Rhizobium rhizogenes]NTF76343.1 DNA helicase [Rhizobium rhizogenes]